MLCDWQQNLHTGPNSCIIRLVSEDLFLRRNDATWPVHKVCFVMSVSGCFLDSVSEHAILFCLLFFFHRWYLICLKINSRILSSEVSVFSCFREMDDLIKHLRFNVQPDQQCALSILKWLRWERFWSQDRSINKRCQTALTTCCMTSYVCNESGSVSVNIFSYELWHEFLRSVENWVYYCVDFVLSVSIFGYYSTSLTFGLRVILVFLPCNS